MARAAAGRRLGRVRESLDNAPWCPQIRGPLDDGSSADAVPMGELMGQEDCLYLNIYAPATAANDGGLPVMMWIHGGSNTWGRAEQYDPSAFAAQENVIIAVVQYRLGPLGWFAHPALRASAESGDDRSVNFGVLDQIAALHWLRDNAAAFGGNSGNITIFGESAGGRNVAALVASRRASGLFHKAIIQSGLFDSVPLVEAERGSDQAATVIAHRLGAEDAASLRAVATADLFKAYPAGEAFDPPQLIEDGVVLPRGGIRAALTSPTTFNAVPIITGTNKDETKLWNILNPDLVRWRFGLIPQARDPEFFDLLSSYQSRLWRAVAVDEPAAQMVAGGHRDVWTYRFDWDEGRTYFGANFGQLFGAAHGLEIPFVFGQFRFLGDADKYIFTKANANGRAALSKAMMYHWAEFARHGTPGGDWPRWSADGPNLLLLDSPAGGGVRMVSDDETADRVLADLRNDPRLTPGQRCKVFFELYAWEIYPVEKRPAGCTAPTP